MHSSKFIPVEEFQKVKNQRANQKIIETIKPWRNMEEPKVHVTGKEGKEASLKGSILYAAV